MTKELPAGGPFKIDPGIAKIFTARLELLAAPNDSQAERSARRRRNALLRGISQEQRALAGDIAAGIVRLCRA